jgi:hypothetical protein
VSSRGIMQIAGSECRAGIGWNAVLMRRASGGGRGWEPNLSAAGPVVGFGSNAVVPGETPGVGTTWLAPGNVILAGVGVVGLGEIDSQ